MRKTILVQIIFITLMLIFVSAPQQEITQTATPTGAKHTLEATSAPTATPKPTAKPTPKATVKPTKRPTPKPTAKPTQKITKTAKTTRSGLRVGDKNKGTLTYYCCCPRCCGSHVKQVKKGVYRSTTASGMRVQTGQAPPYPIASCNWLPLGSKVEAGGTIYTIEDRGGGGLSKRGNLDVYVYQGHKKALAMGRKSVTIRIVRIGR